MKSTEWIEQCQNLVATYLTKNSPLVIENKEVFVVWFSKSLQNKKALFAHPKAPLYFEITANEETGKQFMDVYEKIENFALDLEDN